MNNFIRINDIDCDFTNFIITTKNVDSKSREDMKKVCDEAGLNFDNLTSNIQTHSDMVNVIYKENISKKVEPDAVITNLENVPLLVFTADCVPIGIIDKSKKVIGVVHAGWKGTYNEIVKNTIHKMIEVYGCNTDDLICVIGPSIGKCCYEVSNELAIKFEERFGEGFYNLKDEKYYLDLWKINEYIIKSTKVSNIINLNLCTSCNSKLFHSYRKDNKTDKRIGMIIQINKGE